VIPGGGGVAWTELKGGVLEQVGGDDQPQQVKAEYMKINFFEAPPPKR
jgi:hypothetical protein